MVALAPERIPAGTAACPYYPAPLYFRSAQAQKVVECFDKEAYSIVQ